MTRKVRPYREESSHTSGTRWQRGPLSALAQLILSRFPRLGETLLKASPREDPASSLKRSLLLSVLSGAAFGALMSFLLVSARGFSLLRAITGGAAIGLGVALLLFLLAALILPGVRAGKRAEELERHLLFSLRELRLLVKAGYPLYDAVVRLSEAGYGELSRECGLIVSDLEASVPLDRAFDEARRRNPSPAFGKVLSLLRSALRSGSALAPGLDAAIRTLGEEQKARIRDYAKDLGLWSLLYLLFAVVVPTIGAVMALVLSAFVAGMGTATAALLIAGCFTVQVALIGFVRSRRPLGV